MIDYAILSAHEKYLLARRILDDVASADKDQVMLLLTLAAEAGDCDAACLLGAMHLGVEKHYSFEAKGFVKFAFDLDEGLRLLRMAADGGSDWASNLLAAYSAKTLQPKGGLEYYFDLISDLVGPNVKWVPHVCVAANLLDLANCQGDKSIPWTDGVDLVKYREAGKYFLGKLGGVDNDDIDTELARQFLKLAAEQGDPEAQYELDYLDCEGDLSCYPQTGERAAKGIAWLKDRADAGDGLSQLNYGTLIYWKDSDQVTEYTKYWELALKNGFGAAAHNIAQIYDPEGLDVGREKDLSKAIVYYAQGVELNNGPCGDALGAILYAMLIRHDNYGVSDECLLKILGKCSVEDVKRLLFVSTEIGARNGLICSCARMISLYAEGIGVGADELTAKEWILRADSMGSSVGRRCFDMVVHQGKSVREAVELVRGEFD